MKVAFHCPLVDERGVSQAIFSYAHHNERLLGNRSLVITRGGVKEDQLLQRFHERFEVFTYTSVEEIEPYLVDQRVDLFYVLTHGNLRKVPVYLPSRCRTAVHCVFRSCTPSGDVYACISETVNRRSGTSFPVVPHIVESPAGDDDLRAELGIPAEALVVGRHGGLETFNLSFVHPVVERVLGKRPDIYFVFLNTKQFRPPHPRIIHLPRAVGVRKWAFVNSCDAMIHARRDGETFGLSIGEFSRSNKPVMTWAMPRGWSHTCFRLTRAVAGLFSSEMRLPRRQPAAHLEILGDKALIYHSGRDLERMLLALDRGRLRSGDWDAHSARYSPEPVMEQFARCFF